jgi:hypothetical protein
MTIAKATKDTGGAFSNDGGSGSAGAVRYSLTDDAGKKYCFDVIWSQSSYEFEYTYLDMQCYDDLSFDPMAAGLQCSTHGYWSGYAVKIGADLCDTGLSASYSAWKDWRVNRLNSDGAYDVTWSGVEYPGKDIIVAFESRRQTHHLSFNTNDNQISVQVDMGNVDDAGIILEIGPYQYYNSMAFLRDYISKNRHTILVNAGALFFVVNVVIVLIFAMRGCFAVFCEYHYQKMKKSSVVAGKKGRKTYSFANANIAINGSISDDDGSTTNSNTDED